MQELLALPTRVHLLDLISMMLYKLIYLWYDTDHFISGVGPAKTKSPLRPSKGSLPAHGSSICFLPHIPASIFDFNTIQLYPTPSHLFCGHGALPSTLS
jgi:hypothetical protein